MYSYAYNKIILYIYIYIYIGPETDIRKRVTRTAGGKPTLLVTSGSPGTKSSRFRSWTILMFFQRCMFCLKQLKPYDKCHPFLFYQFRGQWAVLGGRRQLINYYVYLCVYIYIYIYIYIYVYIYIYIERERYMYTRIHIYIYIPLISHVTSVADELPGR